MKKTYKTPAAEMISFQYKEQVAASGYVVIGCVQYWQNYNTDNGTCKRIEHEDNRDKTGFEHIATGTQGTLMD